MEPKPLSLTVSEILNVDCNAMVEMTYRHYVTRDFHFVPSLWMTLSGCLWQQAASRDFHSFITRHRQAHFSAKRGLGVACRTSLHLSVCPSVTLVDCYHIGWNSSKIISPLVSLGCSLSAEPNINVYSKEKTRKFWPKVTHPC